MFFLHVWWLMNGMRIFKGIWSKVWRLKWDEDNTVKTEGWDNNEHLFCNVSDFEIVMSWVSKQPCRHEEWCHQDELKSTVSAFVCLCMQVNRLRMYSSFSVAIYKTATLVTCITRTENVRHAGRHKRGTAQLLVFSVAAPWGFWVCLASFETMHIFWPICKVLSASSVQPWEEDPPPLLHLGQILEVQGRECD